MYAHWLPSKVECCVGAAIAAACAAVPVGAEEFSWHLSGGGSQTDVAGFESDAWSVDATYFLNPVDDSDGPKALAVFLNPTTHVSAAARHRDIGDPDAYTLRGTYVLPGDLWYVGASYAKTKVADELPLVSDPRDYGLLAGRYLGSNTTLALQLDRSEVTYGGQSCFLSICAPFSVDSTADSIGVEFFHVRQFRSLTYSLQGSVSYTDTDADVQFLASAPPVFVPTASDLDTTRVYSIAGELFPTERLGVRIGYSRPDSVPWDSDTYGVSATWFFKPRIAVQFELERTTTGESAWRHADTTAIRFIGRL